MEELCPAWLEASAPGVPADEEVPPGLEVDAEVAAEVEVCEAEPGDWLGVPALGLLPDPPEEEDDDEEEEPEDEEELDDEAPPEDGMPPEEEPLDEVAHPAIATSAATAPSAATRCSCAAIRVVALSMEIAPYIYYCASLSSVVLRS